MSEGGKTTAERIEEIRARALASTPGPFVLAALVLGYSSPSRADDRIRTRMMM